MFRPNIPGWLTEIEAMALYSLAYAYNQETAIAIEIGSLHGLSSAIIARAISKGSLYCIDEWDGGYYCSEEFKYDNGNDLDLPKLGLPNHKEIFLSYTKDFDNISIIQGISPGCVSTWSKPVDFIFLDATHTNPNDWDNIEFWLPKIKSGGRIIGHDYHPRWPDVQENVRHLTDKLRQRPIIVGTLWSFKL